MNDNVAADAERAAPRIDDVVRVLVVHERSLLRDGLQLLLRTDAQIEVCEAVNRAEEASDRIAPDVVLFGCGADGSIAGDVARLQSTYPRAKVLLLDDTASDGRVLLTLRTDARGYLTTRQSGAELVSAVRRTAVGDRVFTPEIAARLIITPEGIRLKRSDEEGPLTGLTPREREVMTYLSLGYTVKQTAATLGLRPSTVDNHKTRLMKKLKVHKTVELTRLAFRYGLVVSDGAPPTTNDSAEPPAAR